MNDITRKLASVRRISNIEDIPNADKIEVASVDGWKVVVQKGLYNINDLVVYFEIDSFLPVEPQYEFLRKGCFRTTANLGDGFRIMTIKLRNTMSQGIILPLNEIGLDKITNADGQSYLDFINEGDDLTEILNVKKFEKPIPSTLTGRVKGNPSTLTGRVKENFPLFIPKTDQERIQNIKGRVYHEHKDDLFEVSTKVDGSSMTVYFKDGGFGVCSRNWDMEDEINNTYWQVFHKAEMGAGVHLNQTTGRNFALQGELAGPGVNNNYAKLKEHEFYLFDIYDIDQSRYLTPAERHYFFTYLTEELGMKIKHVPVWHQFFVGIPSVEYALILADDREFNGLPAEGLVWKCFDGQFSFKAISNKYIMNNDE